MAGRPRLSHDSPTERMNMMITAAELEAVDRWRRCRGIDSRSDAVRQLIARGLERSDDIAEVRELLASKEPMEAARIACGHPMVYRIELQPVEIYLRQGATEDVVRFAKAGAE